MLKAIDEFPARVAALEAGGFVQLRDYNPDTGELEDAPNLPARVTREQLGARFAL